MLPANVKPMSADDHLIEPPDLWTNRLPAAYHDQGPHIVEVDGREYWEYEGVRTPNMMGTRRPLPGFVPTGHPDMPGKGTARYDEIRPGCYNPVARLADMDIDGVWGQLCFPDFSRFAGHRFYLGVKDLDLGLLCTQAYNDYVLDEWCATDPERLFGSVILPLFDIDLAVAELERTIAKGASAISFSENPTVLGLPSVHTDHWDPLWAVANDAGIPVCMHIGSSSKLINTSDDAPTSVSLTLTGMNSILACVDWLMSGAFERFAKLNIVLSEGGAGWVPYVTERADKMFHDKRFEEMMSHERLPSELFAEHVYVCLVDEYFALRSLDDMPIDNMLWEGDYPHGDGLWPDNLVYLEKAFADVPEADAQKIVESNFRRLFVD